MSFLNSTVSSRLRASNPINNGTDGISGFKSQLNGYSYSSSLNGVKSVSNSVPTSSINTPDIQTLLNMFNDAQGRTQGNPYKDELISLVLRLLQQQGSTGPQTGPRDLLVPPKPQPATPSTGNNSMLVTPLGGMVINSSIEPVAAVNRAPVVPTANFASGSSDPKAAIVAASVIRIDSTAPQFKDQAAVWKNAIVAGRTGQPVNVDGDTLHQPSLVSVDSSGALVKVPLTAAVDAPASTISPGKEIQPTAVQPPALMSKLAVVAPQPAAAVHIPPGLVKTNLNGNESLTVPAGFVLAGDVKIFGGKVDAELYTFQGTSGDDKAAMAVVSQASVAMNDLLPSPGVPFDPIMLQHPSISLYSKTSSTGKDMGLWLDAGIAFTGPLADAGSALHDVFGSEVTSVDISAHIGGYQAIGDVFKAPKDLLLTGTLDGLDVKIGKFLELTSAKIELHSVKGASGYGWNINVGGDALITVPGSVAPLLASYVLTKAQSTYTIALTLTNPEWSDAMGVSGFHLQHTVFTAKFMSSSKDSAFSFDIAASFALDSTIVNVTGRYANEGWDFHAIVGDFTLAQVEASFAKLFKAQLLPCIHDVVFTGLSLDITSKDKTLVLKGGARVDTYTSAAASLSLSPTGVHLTGSVADARFDAVTLTKAQLELIVTRSGLVNPDPKTPGTTAEFTLSGEVVIKSAVTIDAQVSFAKSGSSVVWVLYAKAATNFRLSKFVNVSVPKDLDIELESVVAMASNTNDGSLFPIHAFDYKVKKGFRLSAKIDCPPALSKALHTNPVGLILELDLEAAAQEVEFIFAADQALCLKPGMVAPKIKAGIMLTANPQIFVEGDLSVQLPGNTGPLNVALSLQAGATEAQASVSLKSDWINPLHVSPHVKVLAPVTLGVIIDYAAVTYPSGLSFQGKILVGDTPVDAAFEIGENPEDGVLLAHAQNLNLGDIVSFASLVIERKLPPPPPTLLDFKDLYLGISTGGTIGSVFYPPGITFNADIVIFGKEAKVHCAVDKTLPGFKFSAELNSFALGPLTVSGNKRPNPMLDLEFSDKLQKLSVNGKIALFDSDVATMISVAMGPPSITFDAELKFSDLLTFKIDARAAGEIKSIKDVVKSDFSLYALLEQQLLDHMMALANTYIATAKKQSNEGLDSAKAKLAQTQTNFNNGISAAQRNLNSAQATWETKSADVTAAANAQKKALQDQESAKRAAVDQAQKAFNDKIQRLQRELQQTKNDAAAKVQAAQNKLNQATKDADNSINGAKAKLDAAQKDMSSRFGSAEQSIRDAQNRVNNSKSAVDAWQRKVDDCKNTISHGSWGDKIKASFEIAGLEAALRTAKAGLAIANAVLSAANVVISSAAYQAARAAVAVAQGALDAANKAADAGLAVAKGSLSAAQAAEKASVSAAQATLEAAQKGCEELHVWNAAKDALGAFLKVQQAGLTAAAKLITDLSSCAEKIAFDAASAALNAARSATKELSAAQDVLSVVEKSVDEFAAFGQWLVTHTGNVFNVKKVEISGNLNDAANKRPLTAHIVGTFADFAVDEHVSFIPGHAEDFVKGLVMKYVDEAKADLRKFIPHR